MTRTSGAQGLDELERRVLVEEHDAVHGGEGGEHPGAGILTRHRPVGALAEPAHRRVAVDADHEGVALPARRLEQLDVTRMEKIEDAVGEDDGTGQGHTPGDGIGHTAHLARAGGGSHARSARANSALSPGGARKVVTMIMSRTAPNT